MWVRGLKRLHGVDIMQVKEVAPYVGAWIETCIFLIMSYCVLSHPMWVRGLKHNKVHHQKFIKCRTLCGCVD